jgi:hypothetical protein
MHSRLVSFRTHLLLVALTMVTLTLAPAAGGQNISGEVDGVVTDSSGALVPGATITITDLGTKRISRTLTADAHGSYAATLLAVGAYSISVTAPGFKKTDIGLVTVNVGETETSNVSLQTGSIEETVTVEESSTAPNTATPENSAVINSAELKELALNTRNVEQILTIQPGVSYNGPDQLSSGLVNAQGGSNAHSLSVNGLQPTQLSFNFDGADTLNKITINQSVLFPSVEAVSQIKVLRDSYGAQYGGGGSAQVLIVSKAGGSSFHGDAFFFFRDQYLNANNFFNLIANPEQPRPPIRYNDFGGTIGGPLYIPHLMRRSAASTYFFVSEESRRIQLNPTAQVGNYPALAQANGYFQQPVCLLAGTTGGVTKSPTGLTYNCTATPPVTNSPYPGYNYQVPAAAFSPTALQYLKDVILPAEALQQPNSPNLPNSVVLTQKSTTNSNQVMVRLDHNFNSRLSGFFRYIFDPYHMQVPDGYNLTQGFPGVNTSNVYTYGEDFLGHGTFTLTPNTVLDFGYSYLPYEIKTNVIGFDSAAVSPDVQVNTPFVNTTGRVPTLNIGGGNWGAPGPVRTLNHTQQVFENTTRQLGRHTLQFGINYEHFDASTNQGTLNGGAFTFTQTQLAYSAATAATNGLTPVQPYTQSFANFLEGNVSAFTQESIDPVSGIASNLYEAYIQDNWRLLPHFTVQAGVRYSLYGQPYDRFGHLGVFQPNAYKTSATPTINKGDGYECLPGSTDTNCAGVTANANYNPLNGIVQGGINSPYGAAVSRRSFLNFAPRVGFAFDVFGNGKTSLRAGYGVFYDQIANTIAEQQVQGNPAYVQTVTFNATSFASPGAGQNATEIPLNISGSNPNWTTPYTESYSLDIQQQFGPSTVMTLAYVGNKTFHLQGVEDINQPQPGEYNAVTGGGVPANNAAGEALLDQVRPYIGYETINYFDTRYFADYNGLQVGLIHSFGKARGAQLSANYTWSKALANSLGFSNGPQNTYNLATEYGPTNTDRREIFNSSLAYLLPFYRTQRGFRGKLLGGYEVAAIVTAVSGNWATATFTQRDPAGQGFNFGVTDAVERADQISNPNQGRTKSLFQYFNTAAFQQVPTGQFRPGNAQVGNILGPGYQVWNVSLYRNFDLPREFRFQFRVEAFNLFNHVNYSTLNTAFNNTDFGQITAARDNRQLQLGAKLYF